MASGRSKPGAQTSEPAGWAARIVDLSGSVYGTILASAVVVALGYRHHGNAWVMIGALLVTELVFALAHAWSALLSAGRARGELPGRAELLGVARYEWPVLQATWPALVALLLAGAGAFSTETAVTVALGANAVVLFLWGVALAWRQRMSLGVALGAGAVTCALGLVLIALKVLVH